MNEQTRAYIYRVALALLALAVFYGIITEDAAPLIGALVLALFPTGLAVKNTSTKVQ